jgi:hypothetical protein
MAGGWRQNAITVMRWAGYVARMEKMRNAYINTCSETRRKNTTLKTGLGKWIINGS